MVAAVAVAVWRIHNKMNAVVGGRCRPPQKTLVVAAEIDHYHQIRLAVVAFVVDSAVFAVVGGAAEVTLDQSKKYLMTCIVGRHQSAETTCHRSSW